MPLFKQGLWYAGNKAFPTQEQAIAYERTNPQLPEVFGQLNNAPKVMAGTPAPAPQFQPKPMMLSPAQAPAPQQGTERSSGILDLLTQGKSKPSMNQSDVLMAIGSGMLGLSADPNLQRLGVAGFGQVADRSKVRQQSARNNMTVDAMVKSGYISEKQADVLRSNPDLIKGVFEQAVKGQSPSSTIGKLQSDLSSGLITKAQYDQEVARLAKAGQTVVNLGEGGDWTKDANKFILDNMGTLMTQGQNSRRSMIRISQLEQALANAPQGTWGGVVNWATNTLGLELDPNASDVQVADAIISSLVPEQRPAGSGPMSDADLDLFKRSLPKLLGSPEGNAKIISTIKQIAAYDQALADIAQKVILDPEFTPQMGYAEMNKLRNPLDWLTSDVEERRKQFRVIGVSED